MKSFDLGRVPPLTFGAGRRSDLPEISRQLGGEDASVLVVADAVLATLGVLDDMATGFAEAGLSVDIAPEISGEPKETVVDDLTARARAHGATVVIGVGGGAAMDAAKLVATIAPSQSPARRFALSANPLPQDGIPAIAVPTTAGTGSEVTRTSIVSDPAGAKLWYWGEELMFAHAVLDPELTLSLPPHVTAWTGMDAVAHALEAVTSRSSNDAGRLFGLEALQVLGTHLPRAVDDGADLDARAHVLWGATIAGLALHNCNTHMGHNISHSLGSLASIHHGLATGLALEVTLPELITREGGRENYARAAAALGAPGYATALPEAFASLMRSCGIECKLPSVCEGVSQAALVAQMKSPANVGMAENAACVVSHDDLDNFAASMLALPLMEKAA